MRGPAGEHIIQILLEDGQPMFGLATWRPPNQTAVRGRALPMVAMYYGVRDLETGERGPLFYVHVIHAARIADSNATSAEVRIRRYGETEWLERRDWASFADARNDAARDSIFNLAGSVGFGSSAALDMFSTAPQVESHAVTDRNVRVSSGIWNLTYRVVLDALFDRAFREARRRASHPVECTRANDEHGVIVGLARRAAEGP
ncbi:MAG: hypothetical protein J0L52_05580 [Caulobacterales bacterium]|nr:hypothetical protein [Caulobacterales bacterium]